MRAKLFGPQPQEFVIRHSNFVIDLPIPSSRQRRRRNAAGETWNNLATSTKTWPLRKNPDDFARRGLATSTKPDVFERNDTHMVIIDGAGRKQ
jgi:hypothetical protein